MRLCWRAKLCQVLSKRSKRFQASVLLVKFIRRDFRVSRRPQHPANEGAQTSLRFSLLHSRFSMLYSLPSNIHSLLSQSNDIPPEKVSGLPYLSSMPRTTQTRKRAPNKDPSEEKRRFWPRRTKREGDGRPKNSSSRRTASSSPPKTILEKE